MRQRLLVDQGSRGGEASAAFELGIEQLSGARIANEPAAVESRIRGGSDSPPVARRDPEQIAHDDPEPPTCQSSSAAKALARRQRPREEAECVGEIRRRDGDDAEEGEADERVEPRPQVDELCHRTAYGRETAVHDVSVDLRK